MQYAEGRQGRVFVLRVDHGEDFLQVIENFVREKEIRCGLIQFLGALGEGRLVTGPEEEVLPPDPHFESIKGGFEIFGIASIFSGDDGPHIHYHSAVGRHKTAYTGCLRQKARVYIVIEAFIIEFVGITARRIPDPATGLLLPSLATTSKPPVQ